MDPTARIRNFYLSAVRQVAVTRGLSESRISKIAQILISKWNKDKLESFRRQESLDSRQLEFFPSFESKRREAGLNRKSAEQVVSQAILDVEEIVRGIRKKGTSPDLVSSSCIDSESVTAVAEGAFVELEEVAAASCSEITFADRDPMAELLVVYPWRERIVRLPEPASEKYFSNLFRGTALGIIGDRVALDSSFEAASSKLVSELLSGLLECYISSFKDSKPRACAQAKRAIELLRKSIAPEGLSIKERAQFYAGRLRDLQIGEKLLIPAGFVMHSVRIEILCVKVISGEPYYDLHIYDAEGDLVNYSGVSTGELDKKITRLNFKEIPQRLLLMGEGGRAWLELVMGVTQNQSAIDKSSSMISGLFAHFEKPSSRDPGAYELFYRVQQSGTCSWRSLLAWFHYQLDPEAYKCVTTWIGMQTLARSAENIFSATEYSSGEFRMLQICAREMQLHSVLRLEKHRHAVEFDEAMAVSYQISRECEVRAVRVTEVSPIADRIRLDAIESGVNEDVYWSISQKSPLRGKIFVPDPESIDVEIFAPFSGDLHERLKSISEKSDLHTESYRELLANWILYLPPLSQIDRGDIWGDIVNISNLPILFQLQKILGGSDNPRDKLALFKLLAITHYIACAISETTDGGLLKQQKLQNFIRRWLQDRFMIFTENLDVAVISDLSYYFAPYVSDVESLTLVPLPSRYNLDYLGSTHEQAIVRWAYAWLGNLPEEELVKMGGIGGNVHLAIFKFFSMDLSSLSIDHPAYVPFILIHSICLGLEGVYFDSDPEIGEEPKEHSIAAIMHKVKRKPKRKKRGRQGRKQLDRLFDCVGVPVELYVYFKVRGVNLRDPKFANPPSRKLHLQDDDFSRIVRFNKSFDLCLIPSEEEAILEVSITEGLDENLQRALTYCQSQPHQAPAYLIHNFWEDLEKLSDPKISALLTLAMLKTVYLPDGSCYIPFREALLQGSFRTQFSHFINQAILHFNELSVGGMIDHSACMSLARVALIGRSLYKEATGEDLFLDGFEEVLKYIGLELSSRNSTILDQKMHQMLSLYYHCISDDGSEISAQNICISWLRYKSLNEKGLEEAGVGWFQQIAEGLYYQKIVYLRGVLSNVGIHTIVKESFGDSVKDMSEGDLWKNIAGIPTCLQLSISEDSYYRIDLLTGSLVTEHGIQVSGEVPDWASYDSFTKRFPEAHLFRIKGAYVFFFQGETEFKALFDCPAENIWSDSLEINRSGVWMAFVDCSELFKLMPVSLALRYLYFFDKSSGLIRGLSREDFSECALVSRDNVHDIVHHSVVRKIKESDPLFRGILKTSEVEIHESQIKGGQIICRAPSLRIFGGDELSMIFDPIKRGWQHSLYPGYYLESAESEVSPFGTISEYISFRHQDGSLIYYLPVTEWRTPRNASPLVTKLVPQFPKRDLISSLDGSLYLMGYRDGGSKKIQASSVEASVYLAIIWLMQKRVDLFMCELQKIDRLTLLQSPVCEELSSYAAQFFEANPEVSETHLACLVHLIVLIRPFLIKKNKEWIEKVFIRYLLNFSRVPKELRLSPDVEERLVTDLGLDWRLEELRTRDAKYKKTVTKSIVNIQRVPLPDLDHLTVEANQMRERSEPRKEGFPQDMAELLPADVSILTHVKSNLIEYALSLSTWEESDHLDFYIKTQLKLTYLKKSGIAGIKERRIAFLLLLKAVHHIRKCDLTGETSKIDRRIYGNFMRHIPYLMGKIKFSGNLIEHKKRILEDFQNLVKNAAPLIPYVELLESNTSIDSEKMVPATRLNVFSTYKPPSIRLPHPARLIKCRIPSAEMLGWFKIEAFPFREIAPPEKISDPVFLEDIMEGQRRLQERRLVVTCPETDEKMEEVSLEILALRKETDYAESRICELLNVVRRLDAVSILTKRDTGIEKKLDIRDAVYLFLRGSPQLFHEANSALTEGDVFLLLKEIREYLVLKTEEEHLYRISALYEKCKTEPSMAASEKLYQVLASDREYFQEREPYLLVFEYAIGIRLRPLQVKLIRRMLEGDVSSYNRVVSQFMMAGGKTSVLAIILLAMAADKGGFGIYVTPRSQMPMAGKTISGFLKKAFNKELYVLDVHSETLTDESVAELLSELTAVAGLGYSVITCPESLQFLELEFLSRRQHLNLKSSIEDMRLVSSLGRICHLIRTKGHAIIDECHLVLDTHREVNLPSGAVFCLSSDRAAIIKKIYEIICSKDSVIGIVRNCQTDMNMGAFKEIIMPEIAEVLFLYFNVPELNREEFVNYLSNRIKKPLSPAQIKFMSDFKNLQVIDLEKAELIALAKHILSDVLPVVLTKSYNKDYGRTKDPASFKDVPYEDIDTPSTNEFGYHITTACYHMATAIQGETTKEQIATFAKVMREKAIDEAEARGCGVSETVAADEFYRITGVPLERINEPESLIRAFEKLQTERSTLNFENILDMEEIMVQLVVSYYSYRLTSGPHDLLGMFASSRMYSGTPMPETILTNIKAQYVPEFGGLGQVTASLLSRSIPEDAHIQVVDRVSPATVLKTVLAKGKPVSALLDASGMFKDLDNYAVALEIRELFRRSNPKGYKGVLFYTRPQVRLEEKILKPERRSSKKIGEDALAPPDLLAFLPLEGGEIIYLNGTDLASLKEKELLPEECFVFLDKRHTTGTDLVMPPDAVGAIMVDDVLSYPDFVQSIMRLRQYLSTQDVEIVLSRKTLEKIGMERPPTMAQVIALAWEADQVKKRAVVYPSYCQMVDQVARNQAVEMLIDLAVEPDVNLFRASALFKVFRPLITYETVDDPIKMFGDIQEPSVTTALLTKRFIERQDLYLSVVNTPAKRQFFKDRLKLILEGAEESPLLERKQMVVVNSIEQTMQQSMQQTLTIEREQEFERDFNQISSLKGGRPFRQTPWTERIVTEVLKGIREGGASDFFKPISQFYIDPFIEQIGTFESFRGVIDGEILATENFAKVMQNQLPLFHKQSKWITTALLIACPSGLYKTLLISEDEANFWSNYLNSHDCKGVWLIDKNGLSFADKLVSGRLQSDPELNRNLRNPQVERLLIQMNALAGNVSFLVAHEEAAKAWLSIDRNAKIKLIKYAVLSHNRMSQQDLFRTDPLFKKDQKVALQKRAFKVRENRAAIIQGLPPEEIASLLPEYVHLLDIDQVQYLKTPEQIAKLTPSLFLGLKALQVNLIDPDQVKLLTKKDMIQAIERLDLLYNLNTSQLEHLTYEQINIVSDHPEIIGKFGIAAAKKLEANSPNRVSHLSLRMSIESLQDPLAINQLIPEQFQSLTTEQKKCLKNPALIRNIHDAEGINGLDLVEVYEMLLPDQMELISDDNYIKMVQEISDLEILKKITKSARFKRIRLPTEILETLSNQMLYCLTEEHKRFVDNPDFLALSKAKFLSMTDTVLVKVSKEKIVEIVQSLKPIEIHSIRQLIFLWALTLDQCLLLPIGVQKYLNVKQYKLISKKHIALIPHIPRDKLRHTIMSRIDCGEYWLLNYMTDSQFLYIEKRFLQYISIKRRAEIEQAELVDIIKDVVFKRFSDEELLSQVDENISELDPQRINAINNSELVRRLDIDQCMFLKDELVSELSTEQVYQIRARHAKLIPHLSDIRPLLISIISKGQLWPLNCFTDKQLLLIKDQICLSDASEMRTAAVKDPELMLIFINCNKFISDEQLLSISDDALRELPPNRIYEIINPELIHRLSLDQCMHLREDRIKELSQGQIFQIMERHAKLIPYISMVGVYIQHIISNSNYWALDALSDKQLLIVKIRIDWLGELSPERCAAVKDLELIDILRSIGKLP